MVDVNEPRVVLPLVCEQEDVMDGAIKVSADIPVPRVMDELLDTPVSTMNEITNIPVLKDVNIHVTKTVGSTAIPRERGPERAAEQLFEVPAPHVVEKALKVVRFAPTGGGADS